jgi:pimeloyl-ACP methyl ester carboxylesterase
VIVPYLRGYGTTRFLSDETFRNGQQSVLAVDTVALMDVLGIEQAVLAGADWGARTADIVAALWPERCSGLVSVSGYLIASQQAGELPLAPEAERQWWYQYYFATERGRAGYERYRREFARLIWRTASPQWDFDDATFERSAASLDNPDHVAIVIHNYRWRIGLSDGEPPYDTLERRLADRRHVDDATGPAVPGLRRSPSHNVSHALRSFSASSRSPRTIPNTAWRIVAWPKARRLAASFGSSLRAGW